MGKVWVSAFVFVFVCLITLSFVVAETKNQFQTLDIQDDFCGTYINFQYCKCAFHDDWCEQLGTTQSSARGYVQSEYYEFNKNRLSTFAQNCIDSEYIWNAPSRTCIVCDADEIPQAGRCIDIEEVDSPLEEIYPLPSTDWVK